MLIVLIGMILLFSSPNIGIFVIVLGVMVWTSGKSRTARYRDQRRQLRRSRPKALPHLPAAEITGVRRECRQSGQV
ncbi:hypothetical protein [Jhaorihella thermophila]|uniref:Uncharacterized protein n=1 Tax=Jhaorihella thermophila TaxID=488547 RepID=A0A1H5Y1Q0_9RHOB|nr:hypothetical protein [Jhaorihella thermophila]SEG17782.1 hypothetical protein SAMN05421751_1147 [Jhaorihella thermophila]